MPTIQNRLSQFMLHFLGPIAQKLFSLRYKVHVKGVDAVSDIIRNKKSGVIFLPNHTALVDPMMMGLWFWPKYKLRPLVVEYIYRLPLLNSFLRTAQGVPIPNFDTSINQFKVRKAEKSLTAVMEGLTQGDNFLIYPSGKLKSQQREIIGGASGVHEILQKCPDTQVVLVRISGFYGSSFSRAFSSNLDLSSILKKNFMSLLKNGIFFMPRRKIYVDLQPAPSDFPRHADRTTLNNYLEKWYNQYRDDQGQIHEEEPLKLVSYHFWRKDLPHIPSCEVKSSNAHKVISPKVQSEVYSQIRKILEKPNLMIEPEMSLGRDLGMDSLNIAELVSFLLQKYEIKAATVTIDTVQSALEVAEGAHEIRKELIQRAPQIKEKKEKRPEPSAPIGLTIPEAFLNSCKRMGNHIALLDDRVGFLTYRQCRKSVLVLAEHFRSFPETHIAVMLPASAGVIITILALQCAGKVPVMLNWTLGPRYLEQMMEISGAKRILTSWAFIEKLHFVEFGNLIDQIEFLEDIRAKISLKTKIKGVAQLFKHTPQVKQKEDDPAVLLFTSGTEAVPKGVPLTHKNILSDIQGCSDGLGSTFSSQSTLYGFLPPFHSFGFTCGALYSLLCGVRLACSPDPTDNIALAAGIQKWQASHICILPSFMNRLLQTATKEQLSTLRIIIIGGEKASDELYQRVGEQLPKARLVEGYGITECSPVVTISPLDKPPLGVGRLMSCLEAVTIDPETQALLPQGSEGEICLRGPTVFPGYIGNLKSPFIEIEGKSYYRTGDFGYIAPDRTLFLSGRLKRFIKLGGEMISLGAVEITLYQSLLEQKVVPVDPPSIAICADERNVEKPRLILFSTVDLDLDHANDILKKAGFSRLVKISAIQKVSEIPLTGVGKINHRQLQSKII